MKTLLCALAVFPLLAGAADLNPALIGMQTGASHPAPLAPNLDSYLAWATPILQQDGLDSVSAFTPKVFEWYEREKDQPLPPQVAQDPDHIYVNVQGPLDETIALEDAGQITEGNTVGAEVYAEQTGTVHEALETMLFRWGKPVGQWEGNTYPPGGPFQKRVDYFAANPDWGPNAFASLTMRRNGGLVQDLFDRYLVILRGDDEKGYDVFMQYVKPGGETPSEKCFAIALIRPAGKGTVAYKISTRYQGQSYKILGGVRIGRSQIGFNAAKVRAVQVESNGMLQELQRTGTIAGHKTDIGYGQ